MKLFGNYFSIILTSYSLCSWSMNESLYVYSESSDSDGSPIEEPFTSSDQPIYESDSDETDENSTDYNPNQDHDITILLRDLYYADNIKNQNIENILLKLHDRVQYFIDDAIQYGKIIIAERHLPDTQKTIKKLMQIDGIAGGDKYCYRGIFFEICH